MRLLALSHSAVASPYREKWRLLSRRRGWKVRLLVPDRWPEGGGMLAPGGERGLDMRVLPARLPGRLGLFTLKGLSSAIAEFRPDFVYAEEEPYSVVTLQAALAARRAGAGFAFYSWENIPRRYKPPLNWVKKRVFALSAGAVLGSMESARVFGDWGWRGPSLVQPQYGVDTGVFRPAKRASRPFTPGYVGRLLPEKGIDVFLRACALAKLSAVVVGRGPEEGRLKSLASELGLKCAFVPFVPFEQRHQIFSRLDALCLPSRTTRAWKEQFGRVLAEAQACALPCLGSDSGAIPEVIGPAGLVVPEGDPEALASALKRLSSPSLRRKLGKLGRARAMKLFDEKRLSRQLGDFLESLLG